MLVNETTRELETKAATGHTNEDEVRQSTLRIGEGIAGWVAEQQKPVILTPDTDLSRYPDLELKDQTISSAIVVPILLRDELVGVLNISSRSADANYGEEDLQALRVFAENAGTCIRHTEHVEWMRKTIHDTLEHTSKTSKNPKYKKTEALTQE
jgi:signal transduction protein with GAF and PtsI domain